MGRSEATTDTTTSTLTNIDTTKRRILVVEDEEALAVGIRDAIEHAGYEVDVALDGNSALELARAGQHDLIVLDLMLPGQSGIDVLKQLRAERHVVRVLVLTALADEEDLPARPQVEAGSHSRHLMGSLKWTRSGWCPGSGTR